MKSYQWLLLLATISLASAVFTETTDFWTKSLNLTSLHYKAYSGFNEIDWYYPKGQSAMYYSLWTAAGHNFPDASDIIPLIIWLQGGPGASSQFGAFTEVGPIYIEKGVPKERRLPWNIFGHLLCIDQPLNVGFSYAGDRSGPNQVRSAHQAADHLLNFLQNMYLQFPTLAASPLYITGESYAGHYIPAFASAILSNQTFIGRRGIKLAGIAIGDGWTDPINQVNYYDSYLYSAGIVSNKFRDVCTWFQTNSIQNINMGHYSNATTYFDFLTNNDTTSDAYWGGISIFNFRQYNPIDQSFVDFLQRNKQKLGVPSYIQFIAGNDAIYDSFQDDITRSYAADVVYVVSRIPVLIYNGQDDLVVNTAGVLTYLNSLNWVGTRQWKYTRKEIWRIGGEVRGWAKVSGNLWFALVNKAGHMVPTDQPQSAFILLGHFLNNQRDWNQ